mgnify:CR=1 FL=1
MSDFFPLPRVDLLVYSPSPAAFVPVLSELLEPSPRLTNLLIPQLHATLQALIRTPSQLPKTYASLIALCAATVNAWDVDDKAAFLACHPRIGETKGLSAASSAEQGQTSVGAAQGTPGEVLKRLGVSPFALRAAARVSWSCWDRWWRVRVPTLRGGATRTAKEGGDLKSGLYLRDGTVLSLCGRGSTNSGG